MRQNDENSREFLFAGQWKNSGSCMHLTNALSIGPVESPQLVWSAPGPEGFQLLHCSSPLMDRVYEDRLVPRQDGEWGAMNVYVPREEGDLLYSLVRWLKPHHTIEVGMANGLSTFFIAQALKDNATGVHIAIDPFQATDWQNAGVALLQHGRIADRVRLLEQPSHQALPSLESRGIRAQFVFVDGNHLFDYVLTDFLCADRLLDIGGVIAFDDSDWPAITSVIRFALANRRYEIICRDVVIEPTHYSPRLPARLLRLVSRAIPAVGAKMRADFLAPSHVLGIRGRCVALRKLASDDRDGQSRFHVRF